MVIPDGFTNRLFGNIDAIKDSETVTYAKKTDLGETAGGFKAKCRLVGFRRTVKREALR